MSSALKMRETFKVECKLQLEARFGERGVRKLKVKCLQTAVLELDMNRVSRVLERLL